MTVAPFPLKNPTKPSNFHIFPNAFVVLKPLYSTLAVYCKILSLSRGLVAVLDIAPAIPPVKRWP